MICDDALGVVERESWFLHERPCGNRMLANTGCLLRRTLTSGSVEGIARRASTDEKWLRGAGQTANDLLPVLIFVFGNFAFPGCESNQNISNPSNGRWVHKKQRRHLGSPYCEEANLRIDQLKHHQGHS